MQAMGPSTSQESQAGPGLGVGQGTALHPAAPWAHEPAAASAGANHHSGAAPRSQREGNHSKCPRRCEGLGTGQQQEGCWEAQSSARQAE